MNEEIKQRLQDALDALPPRENPAPFNPAAAVELMRLEGQPVTQYKPGKLHTNAEGELTGMDAPTHTAAQLGHTNLTADEWEQVARYLLHKLDDKENQK